ncbi:MAG: hypothetical protein R2932_12965 [Caldilineaceae bacterium]
MMGLRPDGSPAQKTITRIHQAYGRENISCPTPPRTTKPVPNIANAM